MRHTPVLSKEVIEFLHPQTGENFVDATFGAGGHTIQILEKTGPAGRVLAIERDPKAYIASEPHKMRFGKRLILVQDDFRNLKEIAHRHSITAAEGILFDLGMSSDQLDDPKRGLSFQSSGTLDMRFDQTAGYTAQQVLDEYPVSELARIFREYGEERYARRIARAVVSARSIRRIENTQSLFDCIRRSLPQSARKTAADSARRIFQALRIEVNQELDALQSALPQAHTLLAPGGKLAVISFHSLEDRIVKRFFQEKLKGCTCPPEFPVCICGKHPQVRVLTRKPVTASEEELAANPRARSAKLRVAQKLG
ncbi:MAG: 16S rRNA (cytosine(1402)-N(4))-methyltransferase [Candidatus Doudnabacteria bacterium RIFCSPHIGHO2_01_FULL_50_11]|uniref:Ribosomal RNA small subunit methyltransferase H n=1 Tax=Candidatus Doudnabacteria bacterium RIFCSPHIGHO2_01_FULL_50_11 TaxID=1817828 RepID=A0A1F5PLM5_9BACT|nr:MAG: 16S rRNA (cytosine(1402)-N(4))-methyltransferase [Candidatus Doudnabacteria bacterium RIFCSPHIGHO2_01_FULL_50_11]